MTRAYNVVDADGLEPLDLWDTYMDPEFRERRPRFVIDENGKERLSVEGKLVGHPRGITPKPDLSLDDFNSSCAVHSTSFNGTDIGCGLTLAMQVTGVLRDPHRVGWR